MPLASGAIAIDSGTVLVLITLLVAPIAALVFARSGPAWQSIGKGPLAIEPAPPAEGPDAGRERAEMREEVRQMLVARNERRRHRGLEPLDVEAETDRRLADFVGSR
jgi:hypothetical protein